jgi:hypothetical protein
LKKEISNYQKNSQQVPAGSQNTEKDSFFKKVNFSSCLMYSQIWLNVLVNDHQFGYITELKK